MRTHLHIALTTLILGTSSAAMALELNSPSLVANPDNALECRIVNLSSAARNVTITTYDSTGAVVGTNTIAVAANGWGGISLSYTSGPGAGYCSFSIPGVGQLRAFEYRASINVLKPGHGIISALPAH